MRRFIVERLVNQNPSDSVRRAFAYRQISTRTTIYDELTYATPLLGSLVAAKRVDSEQSTSLILVLPSFAPEVRYAGINTALNFGVSLAKATGVGLKVFTVDYFPPRLNTEYSEALRELSGIPNASVHTLVGGAYSYTSRDYWVATYWTTAHILQMAARMGAVDAGRVVYLVQDYEPRFFPWSSDSAIAQATYHAGFMLVVNSMPLANFIAVEEQVRPDPDLVFAPALDYARLSAVAESRRFKISDPVQIFFYARPQKPRNLFPIGVAALRQMTSRLEMMAGGAGSGVRVVTAGAQSATLNLGGVEEVSLGMLSYDQYYDLLAESPICLSLMMSPHPSHPPLEAAVSGGIAITNSFGVHRNGLHPNIRVAKADPDALASVLSAAVQEVRGGYKGRYAPIDSGDLGSDVKDVVVRVAKRLQR